MNTFLVLNKAVENIVAWVKPLPKVTDKNINEEDEEVRRRSHDEMHYRGDLDMFTDPTHPLYNSYHPRSGSTDQLKD